MSPNVLLSSFRRISDIFLFTTGNHILVWRNSSLERHRAFQESYNFWEIFLKAFAFGEGSSTKFSSFEAPSRAKKSAQVFPTWSEWPRTYFRSIWQVLPSSFRLFIQFLTTFESAWIPANAESPAWLSENMAYYE